MTRADLPAAVLDALDELEGWACTAVVCDDMPMQRYVSPVGEKIDVVSGRSAFTSGDYPDRWLNAAWALFGSGFPVDDINAMLRGDA